MSSDLVDEKAALTGSCLPPTTAYLLLASHRYDTAIVMPNEGLVPSSAGPSER